jgi:hypothetical protein
MIILTPVNNDIPKQHGFISLNPEKREHFGIHRFIRDDDDSAIFMLKF